MTLPDSKSAKYQVVCICGGHGFPRGTATAARITMIGRALRESGVAFRVLHCGPSPNSMNTERAGVYEGIPFQYTTTTRFPKNRFFYLAVYLWATFELTLRMLCLFPSRSSIAVYLYLMEGPLVLYIGLVCRMLGLPVIQELCEWWPGDPRCGRFDKWLYRKPLFELASGSLVISKTIEERVRETCSTSGLDLLIQRVPVLVDAARFMNAPVPAESSGGRIPEFLYCGTWNKDLYFLIRVLRLIHERGFQCRLRLVLGLAEYKGPSLLKYASEQGLSGDDLLLVGSVDHSALGELYKRATGLLMPLWSDDRSITRLPNKMGEYLASGQPVIASEVGDLRDLLTDDVNAYLVKPDDEQAFAEKMIAVLQNLPRAEQIGTAGQHTCLKHLDFRQYASTLSFFFSDCIRKKGRLACLKEECSKNPL